MTEKVGKYLRSHLLDFLLPFVETETILSQSSDIFLLLMSFLVLNYILQTQ